MKDVKDEILSDAIRVAIENSEKIIKQRIAIEILALLLGISVVIIICLVAR